MVIFFILFIVFFFQVYINVIYSFFILFMMFIINIFYNSKYRIEILEIILVVFVLIIFYLFNILIHSLDNVKLYKELFYIDFYRYDGRLFVMPVLFVLFLISFKINFFKALKYLIIIETFVIFLFFILRVIFHFHNKDFFSGPFCTHNALGGFSASLILLSLFFYKKNKIFSLFFAFINFVFLIFSASRTFLLALFIVIFIYFSFFEKRKILKILLIFSLLGVFMYVIYPESIYRFFDKSTQDMFNVIFRLEAQKLSWNIFLQHFLYGIGIGNIDTFLKELIPFRTETEVYKNGFLFSDISPHNTFLTILSEQGIIGFVIFLFVHLFLLVKAYKHFPLYIYVLILQLFLLLIISSFFGNSFFSPSNSGIFYIVLALAFNNFKYKLHIIKKLKRG